MRCAVMIPTYNERDNIARLLGRLFELELPPGDDLRVVVVDDDSPDGTGKLVEELRGVYGEDRLFCIHRKGVRGRGTAGIAGLRAALAMPEVDCILEMDADFSHDPGYIPTMMALARHYDVVIGSRFVEGGAQTDREWWRELLSLGANAYYRWMLGVKFRDVSGGFKCYRREALASLDWDRFLSTGYPIGMETVYRLYKKSFSFVEIPVIFPNRAYGV
ncbi:MAG: glycosyltransferase, partial [Candidatus Methylomirabilis sp.]|nr:glycosyltransferase [Deltaproteobacteria bacterium]